MVSDILADRHRAKVKQALADHANGVVTDKLYTLSDLEALRERCAKEADRLAQNIADESHRSASVEAIARAREGAVCAVAERIRALPLTPQTEEGTK